MINGRYGLRGDALNLLKVKTSRSVGELLEEQKFSKESGKENSGALLEEGNQPTDTEDIFIVLHFDRLLIYFFICHLNLYFSYCKIATG